MIIADHPGLTLDFYVIIQLFSLVSFLVGKILEAFAGTKNFQRSWFPDGYIYIYIITYPMKKPLKNQWFTMKLYIYIDNIRQQNSSKFSKYIHEKTWTCTWKSSISGMCGWILLLVSSPKWIIHTVATSVAAPMSSMGKSPSIRWLSQPYFTNIWQK